MIEPELLEEFLAESTEHLASVEGDVLALERGEATAETVNKLFRALHTVKGAASFLNLRKVTTLAHALEEVVGKFRAGTLVPSEQIVDTLLRGLDQLKLLLESPEDGSYTIDEEVEALQAISQGRAIKTGNTLPVLTLPPEVVRAAAAAAQAEPVGETVSSARAAPASPEPAPPSPTSEAAPPQQQREETPEKPEVSHRSADMEQTVRIPLVLLDKLMNLASELVLVRNQNMQALASENPEQLAATAQRLNVVTSELQAGIMQTRMRPIKPVFNRFVRVVRDLAKKLGKDIELSISGADVELDKNIIEAIGDPLTHLIRNAADHGIEPPSERRERGKSPRGKISLSAAHQAGQVVIQIEDDGRGIERESLKRAAVEKGLLTVEQAEEMAERDAYNIIFLPGFSTSSVVTDVSGRGVGMDAVRAAFKTIGGVIDVSSKRDMGTCITIKLPLTLAIVPALIVAVEELCFAIPQVSIDEVVLLHGADSWQELKIVDDQEVYWLRGKLLPVLRLSNLLGIQKTFIDPATGERQVERRQLRPDRRSFELDADDDRRSGVMERRVDGANSSNIVVVKLGGEQFGLLVDSIIDTEEIVVKSLHDQLKNCGAYAGTTVLGDGRIAMILDVAALVELGQLRFTNMDGGVSVKKSSGAAQQTVLLFNIGGSETFAVPLCLIRRVEEIRCDQIQLADRQEHLAYRGGVMRLLRIGEAVPTFDSSYGEVAYVLIPRGTEGVGILAASIMDTVEIPCEIDSQSLVRDGIFGSLMYEETLILLLDLLGIVDRLLPESMCGNQDRRRRRRLLLVEDSAFYSALLEPYLKSVGFDVTLSSNGLEALEALRAEEFELVVSDIEMPVMDGFELVRQVRADERLAGMRMIAISAAEGEMLSVHALEAGYDEFESKLDQAKLLRKLSDVALELERSSGHV